jgi:hypothetical protein
VASFRFDGIYLADASDDQFVTLDDWYAFVRSTIDSLLGVPSPMRINIVENQPLLDSVYVTFDVVADGEIPDTLNLHLVVNEWRHRYPFPVGAHDHAMREMLPDSDGFELVMQQGDSVRFEWAYYIV